MVRAAAAIVEPSASRPRATSSRPAVMMPGRPPRRPAARAAARRAIAKLVNATWSHPVARNKAGATRLGFANQRAYQARVRSVLRLSYTHHYRRMLPPLLAAFTPMIR